MHWGLTSCLWTCNRWQPCGSALLACKRVASDQMLLSEAHHSQSLDIQLCYLEHSVHTLFSFSTCIHLYYLHPRHMLNLFDVCNCTCSTQWMRATACQEGRRWLARQLGQLCVWSWLERREAHATMQGCDYLAGLEVCSPFLE